MDNDLFRDFLQGIKFQVPYLVAYLIGFIAALCFWKRFPRASAFVLAACSIKLLAALAAPLSAAILLRQLDFRAFEIVTLAIAVIDALASGLLLTAVFVGRAEVRPFPRD